MNAKPIVRLSIFWIVASIALIALNAREVRAGVIFTNLHSFSGGNDGVNPNASLIQGPDGNFYGTTSHGGAPDYGVVYKLFPDGSVTNLVTFDGTNLAYPASHLTQGKDGVLYGTTSGGGPGGSGNIFGVTSDGVLTNVLYLISFAGHTAAGVVQDEQGNFYCTSPSGGELLSDNNGTVYKINADDEFEFVIDFTEGTGDGRGPGPQAGLILARDGSFYGTSMYGGTNGTPGTYADEDGMIFKLTSDGELSVFASFDGGNGAFPVAELVQGADGSFYGTAEGGGASGWGTVFQVTPDGMIKPLYVFQGGSDGGNPQSTLVQDSQGILYGTTMEGGINDNGTVFQITTNGNLTTLYSFHGDDGRWPLAGLLLGKDGNFYGTTLYGGDYGGGVIFRLTITPSLPVLLAASQLGTQIVISWSSDIGETYQAQRNPSLSSTNWVNLGNPIAGNETQLSITNSVSESQQYFRVVQSTP